MAPARLRDVKAIPGILFGLVLAFLFSVRADEPSLAPVLPQAPFDLNEAHARLDVDYVEVPPDKLGLFSDRFDATGASPDLADILRKTDGRIVASASTSLCLGGDGTMLEMAGSRLTLQPRVIAQNQFHLDGRVTRSTFSGTFDVLLQPGVYQLFILWDQPAPRGDRDPYNAIVARVREISVEGADGTVRYLLAKPSPPPLPDQIHAANR